MGTVPTMPDARAGVPVTASDLNTFRDAANFLLAPPRVSVTRSAAWTRSSSSTPSLLNMWDTQIIDTDNMWTSGTPGRFTVQTAGLYQFSIFLHYVNSGSTGICHSGIAIDAAGIWPAGAGNGGRLGEDVRQLNHTSSPQYPTSTSLTLEQYMDVGDYCEFYSCQTSGSTLTMETGTFAVLATGKWVAAR